MRFLCRIFSAFVVVALYGCGGGGPEKVEPPKTVEIEGGTYKMGSKHPAATASRGLHKVTVGGFALGTKEVTNAEYCQFLNSPDTDPSGRLTGLDAVRFSHVKWLDLEASMDKKGFGNLRNETVRCRIIRKGDIFAVEKGFEGHPVNFVTWYGAMAYCRWLSTHTDDTYRLPTRSEWEYAARLKGKQAEGPKQIMYSWGGSQETTPVGNIADESFQEAFGAPESRIWPGYNDKHKTIAAVGSFPPNELGLYDMAGNVYEWCLDASGCALTGELPRTPFCNGKNFVSLDNEKPQTGMEAARNGKTNRLRIGGSWASHAYLNLPAGMPSSAIANHGLPDVGFRVLKEIE